MKQSNRCYHLHVLSLHSSNMSNNLIYHHNLTTDTIKEFILLDSKGDEWKARGYVAVKEVDGQKVKYFIQEQDIQFLPIRADETVEFFMQDNTRTKSIINTVQNPTPFRISPDNV